MVGGSNGCEKRKRFMVQRRQRSAPRAGERNKNVVVLESRFGERRRGARSKYQNGELKEQVTRWKTRARILQSVKVK